MEWKDWEGKHVFLRTKHGKVYSGIVKHVSENSEITFLQIIDKYGQPVMFAISEIIEIKEEEQL